MDLQIDYLRIQYLQCTTSLDLILLFFLLLLGICEEFISHSRKSYSNLECFVNQWNLFYTSIACQYIKKKAFFFCCAFNSGRILLCQFPKQLQVYISIDIRYVSALFFSKFYFYIAIIIPINSSIYSRIRKTKTRAHLDDDKRISRAHSKLLALNRFSLSYLIQSQQCALYAI